MSMGKDAPSIAHLQRLSLPDVLLVTAKSRPSVSAEAIDLDTISNDCRLKITCTLINQRCWHDNLREKAMNRQMPTSDTKDAEPQWNDTRDYLADPALWFDVLPQPFRMIDQLLSGILETVWETIEEREESKKRERSKFRVPMCSKVEVIEAVTGVKCICGGRDGIIFVGCSDGLRVFQVTKGGRPQLVGGAGGHSVEHLSTGWSGELQLVAAVGGGGWGSS